LLIGDDFWDTKLGFTLLSGVSSLAPISAKLCSPWSGSLKGLFAPPPILAVSRLYFILKLLFFCN
jgi:hypothetical protein